MHSLEFRIIYFNAIAVCKDESGTLSFKKYHSIRNIDKRKGAFLDFIKNKFPHVQYVNFYNKENKRFVERIYMS